MKRILYLFMVICVYSATYAQNLTVKSVNLRPQDTRAAMQPREDKGGKKCAIIRVGVVGVDDLVFPAAVGNVERALSEYIVYVPDGLKTLQYENKSGKRLGSIVFDDYGLEINSLNSYDVIFESENHLRSAIFSVQPQNAQLLFNGKKVEIDADGMAMVNAPIGEYPYQISAKGFESQSGTVTLTEDEISTVTDVVLQEILYPVTINVFPEDATVFIDNVPYTKEARKDLQLSSGKHSFRVTAANYEDAERTIEVNGNPTPIYFALNESRQKIVKHKEERTRTKVNIRNAFYLTGGLEQVSDVLAGLKGDFSFVHHFGGIFAMREGIGVSFLGQIHEDDMEVDIDSVYIGRFDVEVPIQLGLSIPLEKYNKHLFSVFVGGYGRASFFTKGSTIENYDIVDDIVEMYRDKFPDHFELKKYYFDIGFRASAKLDISKFTIRVDVSRSLNGHGFSKTLTFGCKLYTLKKKKKNK